MRTRKTRTRHSYPADQLSHPLLKRIAELLAQGLPVKVAEFGANTIVAVWQDGVIGSRLGANGQPMKSWEGFIGIGLIGQWDVHFHKGEYWVCAADHIRYWNALEQIQRKGRDIDQLRKALATYKELLVKEVDAFLDGRATKASLEGLNRSIKGHTLAIATAEARKDVLEKRRQRIWVRLHPDPQEKTA